MAVFFGPVQNVAMTMPSFIYKCLTTSVIIVLVLINCPGYLILIIKMKFCFRVKMFKKSAREF